LIASIVHGQVEYMIRISLSPLRTIMEAPATSNA
jgi:hypothetical protein